MTNAITPPIKRAHIINTHIAHSLTLLLTHPLPLLTHSLPLLSILLLSRQARMRTMARSRSGILLRRILGMLGVLRGREMLLLLLLLLMVLL